jgi:hypothetical protein
MPSKTYKQAVRMHNASKGINPEGEKVIPEHVARNFMAEDIKEQKFYDGEELRPPPKEEQAEEEPPF